MEDLNGLLDLRTKLDAWGRIAIIKFQNKLRKLDIGVTDELFNSFEHKVQQTQSEVLGIAIKFRMYGRYRDMNVGRGLGAHERAHNNINRGAARRNGANVQYVNRSSKKWYNKTKMSQIYRLRDLLGEDLGNSISRHIADSLNQTS